MNDSNLAVYEGVFDGLEKAASNITNITIAKQDHEQKKQLFDIQKKKGELDIKEQEALGADPEVLEARKSIFTLNAKQAKLGLEKDTLLLSEAQKKAKRDMADRQKEAQWVHKLETNKVPTGLQVETKVGDTTVSNKKAGGMEDLFSAAGNGQAPITSPEERQAFVEKLPTGVKEVVQGLTNYDMDLTKISSYRGNQRLQLAAAAKIADPTFDMSQYPARQKYRQEFTSGKIGGNIRSFNTAIGHLGQLDEAADKTPSSGVKLFEKAQRGYAEQFAGRGKAALGMKEEDTALTAVVGEMGNIFKQTGATDPEIDKWMHAYDKNAPIEAKRTFIKTGAHLMLSRLDALHDDYVRTMGKEPEKPLISDKAEATLQHLMQKYDTAGSAPKITPEQRKKFNDAMDAGKSKEAARKEAGF